MSNQSVLYEKDGRLARITLNRPNTLNAIDLNLPAELENAVKRANADQSVRAIVLSGAGRAFCSGYDLDVFAHPSDTNPGIQEMPWDPITDFTFMKQNTDHFMSLWRSLLPVICKVHGYALAGGSDIALCADILMIGENAEIGYPPARVWGCPTTAMWVYRIGTERAKRMLLTGEVIDGRKAENWGLGQAFPESGLDEQVERLANTISTIPRNQLIMHKLMINQTLENMGLTSALTQATLFDGISRHSPEGINFRERISKVGWKQAVEERDKGTFDWTNSTFFDQEK